MQNACKYVSKYDYIIVHTNKLGGLNRPHLPILSPPVTAKQRLVIIPGNQPEGSSRVRFNVPLDTV